MVAGVAPDKRQSLLASARRLADKVAESCRRAGVSPDELPPRSRDALAYVREIASLSPELIPLPREPAAAPKRIHVRRVVQDLEDCVQTLALPGIDAHRLESIFDSVRLKVAVIEQICADGGSGADGDPARVAPDDRAPPGTGARPRGVVSE